jgi:hypothetical protein
MPGLTTKPQAMSFEDGGKGKQPDPTADFGFEVALLKYPELQATNIVRLREIEELKKIHV